MNLHYLGCWGSGVWKWVNWVPLAQGLSKPLLRSCCTLKPGAEAFTSKFTYVVFGTWLLVGYQGATFDSSPHLLGFSAGWITTWQLAFLHCEDSKGGIRRLGDMGEHLRWKPESFYSLISEGMSQHTCHVLLLQVNQKVYRLTRGGDPTGAGILRGGDHRGHSGGFITELIYVIEPHHLKQ